MLEEDEVPYPLFSTFIGPLPVDTAINEACSPCLAVAASIARAYPRYKQGYSSKVLDEMGREDLLWCVVSLVSVSDVSDPGVMNVVLCTSAYG